VRGVKALHIGQLKAFMSLEENTVTVDSGGERSNSWAEIDTLFGRIDTASAMEQSLAAQNGLRLTHSIAVRYREDFGTGDTRLLGKYRLVYDGRTFEVRGVSDPDEGKRFLVLTCSEES
jgi:SPP1 family predicted phage head-tail adaptor